MHDYTLPDLGYGLNDLEPHYSGEILELHHGAHHAAYVKGANATLADLEQARAEEAFGHINQLEKNLAFHLSGHLLHSLLWKNLNPGGGGEPDGALGAAIDQHFGSFAQFKAQLNAAAMSLQGSGWASLSWEPMGQRLVVEQVHDHQSNIGAGTIPLLVLDMWEHAFYLQYRNVKADWVKAYWNIVHWADVQARFDNVKGLSLAL